MKKKTIKCTIKVLTGMHIGAGNDKVQIGGVDSAVIKDPISSLPYIPGSSLKGKIRCLLETEGGFEGGQTNEELNKCFGLNNDFRKAKKDDIEEFETPTRLIFRDFFLNDECKQMFSSGQINTEFKTEIVIDRTKGTAKTGGLRTIERVPPEIVFEGDILLRYDGEEEMNKIKKVLSDGISLLNNDFLGGSGSRGYGAVHVELKG
jgi:CRISPR-associated protein Csm3